MLFQEHPALEELALRALVKEPGASAKRIFQLLNSQGHAYTLRGVYKELAKLTEQGILFKSGQSYNLRLAWITKLLAFGDQAFERYTAPSYLAGYLGGDYAKHSEKFTDIRKLDRLWTQLIFALHQMYPSKIMCFWCPYQWFYLAHYFTCTQFYEAIDLAGFKRVHIIGTDTYLGRRALNDLPKGGVYSFAESPFHHERTTYYTVIGDIVVTVKLDEQVTARIHSLFQTVRSESELDPEVLEKVFGARVKATLRSEKNPKKAASLKKKFANFFGTPIT